MNEAKARKFLGWAIKPDDSLYDLGRYTAWRRGADNITLDDNFSVDEIEAIAWWMKNK